MITILSTPQKVAPVYNPIYFKVSSDKTSEESFNFLFDVYVNGVFVNRDKLLSRPGITQTIYSPARVLESYVSYDLTHNLNQETTQTNCAKDYKVIFGEEYVRYFNINQIKKDTITSTSYTIIQTIEDHTYIVDDTIIIKDMPIPYQKYNGIHFVESIIDSKNILIRKTYTEVPTTISTTAKTTYSDKRKTVYITDTPILLNGTTFAGNDWDVYGPDGCNVVYKVFNDNTMKLVVPDVTCGTAFRTNTHQSISLVPGRKYKVQLNVSAINNPSGEPVAVYAKLGSVNGVIYSTTGVYNEYITAAGGIDFAIVMDLSNADTSGFGSHSITLSDIDLYEAQPFYEGKVFNAVMSYEKYAYWNYIQNGVGVIFNGPFLTKQPKTLKVQLTDFGSISWLNNKINSTDLWYLKLGITDILGNYNVYTYDLYNMSNDVTISNTILHIPAHPVSVNKMTDYAGDGELIDATTVKYTIQIFKDINPLSEIRTFEIDTKCSRYNPIQFMFLNSLGSFDFYTSTLLSRTTINVTRDTYTQTLELGYSRGDRGKTVINVNAQETYIAHTDWISEETSDWLAYEFFLSNEVYIIEEFGFLTPIIIDNSTIEPKKRVNDKLINYQFNYSKAVPVNTKRN